MKADERSTDLALTVYRPNMRRELGFLSTWIVMSKNVFRSRELIWQLFRRDFLACYKKSFIGFAWVFLSPLLGIFSWVFLHGTGMLRPGDVGIPYPAYVLVGSSMWGLFMGFYQAAGDTLPAGRDLVMQVSFPHEALLFKESAQHVANFLISFVLNIVVLLLFRVTPSPAVLLLPLVALPLFFLGSAVGLVVSLVGVVAVDMGRIVNLSMGLLLYATPVIYAEGSASQFVKSVNFWNPLTYLVCSCRDIIIYGRLYRPLGYFICSGIAFVLFLVSWRLFYVSNDKIVERMI